MKKLILVLAILVLLLMLITAGTAQAKNPLRGVIEYDFVGHLGTVVDGRLLAWEGTISGGDIDGTIQWWMGAMESSGQASHYTERWEIKDGEELLMAGDDRGTTTTRHGKNSTWRTNGVITEAYGDYADWIGRQTHMSGHFTWAAPGLPEAGTGTFRVN